jgi:hypothetical protein
MYHMESSAVNTVIAPRGRQMSLEALKWACTVYVGNADEKHTLIAVANHHNAKTGECFPGQETLAAETERSVDTIQRHLKSLAAKGLLNRHRRYRDGYRTSDGYTLAINGKLKPQGRGVSDTELKPQPCGVSSEELKPQDCGVSADDLTPQNPDLTPQNSDVTPQNTPTLDRTAAAYKDEREEQEDIEREGLEPAAADATAISQAHADERKDPKGRKQRKRTASEIEFHEQMERREVKLREDWLADHPDKTMADAMLVGSCGDTAEGAAAWAEWVAQRYKGRDPLDCPSNDVIVAELVEPFEQFWEAWPYKQGKADAKKVFLKIIKEGKVTLETILKGVKTYKRTKPDWREWKLPAGWLRGERWNDEPVPARNRGNVVEAADQLVAAFASGDGSWQTI